MFSTKRILMSATAAALLFGGASAAHAQYEQHDTQGMPPAAEQQSYDISDDQLSQFVAAQHAAGEVQEKYQEVAQDISSQEEMNALQQQMNVELIEAVEGVGLSVDEYNMIMAALQTDPEIQEKYTNMMR